MVVALFRNALLSLGWSWGGGSKVRTSFGHPSAGSYDCCLLHTLFLVFSVFSLGFVEYWNQGSQEDCKWEMYTTVWLVVVGNLFFNINCLMFRSKGSYQQDSIQDWSKWDYCPFWCIVTGNVMSPTHAVTACILYVVRMVDSEGVNEIGKVIHLVQSFFENRKSLFVSH